MRFAIDTFFIVIALFFPAIYYKKGLLGSVLGFGRIVLSTVAAIAFGRFLAQNGSENVFGGAIALFLLTYVALTVIIFCLKHVNIPFVTRFDRILGLLLGAGIGLICLCLMSSALYTVLELISSARNDGEIMDVYNNSLVFKFIYDLGILEYIRNLI